MVKLQTGVLRVVSLVIKQRKHFHIELWMLEATQASLYSSIWKMRTLIHYVVSLSMGLRQVQYFHYKKLESQLYIKSLGEWFADM